MRGRPIAPLMLRSRERAYLGINFNATAFASRFLGDAVTILHCAAVEQSPQLSKSKSMNTPSQVDSSFFLRIDAIVGPSKPRPMGLAASNIDQVGTFD